MDRHTFTCRRKTVRRQRVYFVLAALSLALIPSIASAQTACNIGYKITSQWAGGFGAALAINNTGTTAISNWTLTWSFANGQTVTQLWNGSVTQSGANVTVTNLSYDGSIPAGGSLATVGFNGTWNNSTNAVPTSFSLNGVTCGGMVGGGSFKLSPSASTLSVAQGASGTDTITITDSAPFSGNVTLSASGLPTGVTASFGTNPAATSSVLTLTAGSTAAAGTSAVTITGTSGTLSASTAITLTVTGAGGFTLAPSANSLSVAQGANGTDTIAITDISPFSGSVTLAASGLPTGVTASFGTNPAATSSVLTLTAGSTAAAGTSTVTITGTSGTLTASTAITLTVTGAGGFTLAPSANSLSVAQGANGTDAIAITDISPFSGSVTLAASGLPTGVTVSFGTNPATTSSVLTLTAGSTAAAGTSTVTITGTSGTLTASTNITLTVTTPTSSSCNVTYTISPQSSSAFGASLVISNTGTTAWTSWTLTWVFANGQTVAQLWNGNVTQSGALVTVTNASYDGNIPAGGSLSSVGFNGTRSGTNSVPTAFEVNGSLCGANGGGPPLAPTGLAATAGNRQIALSWTASLAATSYNVKRSTTSGGPYTTVGSPTTTSFTDTSVTNGATYYYVVSASNSAGQSPNSNQVFATPAAVPPNVTIVVNPAVSQPISPWIYGINGASIPNVPDVTLYRLGGNRWTAYNWETNASNAGSDFVYENDGFLSGSSIAGEAVIPTIASDIAGGKATLMTVQLQGLVSGDEAGPVSVSNPPNLTRFKTVVDQKSTVSSAPFTTTPPPTGPDVFMDEFVWAMNQAFPGVGIFGGATATPTFVDLDNEPELWSSTHLEVQGPTAITPSAYIAKTIALTEALKNQFPSMIIFGPAHYGFLGIYSWQTQVTTATPTGANWFTDMYLQAISGASATYGRPLVDVYDFHWYPEDYDVNGLRVTSMTGASLTDAQMQLVVQAPRNLWDPTFTDPGNSIPWVNSVLGGSPIYILPRLQSKIGSEFPSMKLSISEYEAGGFNNIAGTVAQADELGVFATQGVFAAMFWPPGGTYDYTLAGFRAFRNFDGAKSNFGDTLLQTTSSNVQNVVVYASTDSKTPGRVVLVAINRSSATQVTAVTGLALSGTASQYQITAASAQGQSPVTPVSIGQTAVSGSSLTLTLPAYSVTTIDVQ